MKTLLRNLFTLVIIFSATITNYAQTFQEALLELASERPSKAENIAKTIIAANPTAENYFELGHFYLRLSNWEEAAKAFNQSKELDSKSDLPDIGLATILVGQGKLSEAKPKLNELLDGTKGKDVPAMYRIMQAYTMFYDFEESEEFNQSNNDPGEALRIFDMIQERILSNKKEEEFPGMYIVKGDAYIIQNNGGDAVTAYEYALKMDPSLVDIETKIGSIFLRGKNYKESQIHYKKAIDLNPEFAPVYRKYGEYLIIGQQFKTASKFFKDYLAKAEPTPEDYLQTAKLLFLSKDYSSALEYTAMAEQLGVEDLDIFRMKGYSYIEENQFEIGLKNLEQMVASGHKPFYQDDYYFGKAYQGLKNDSLALVYYNKAAELDTNNNVYMLIQDIHYSNKDYLAAGKSMEKAIDWNLTYGDISSIDYFRAGMDFYIAAAYMDREDTLGRPSMAMHADSLFSSAIELNPYWPPYYINRARNLNIVDYSGTQWLGKNDYENFIHVSDSLTAAGNEQYKANPKYYFEAYKYLGGYIIATDTNEGKEDRVKEYFDKALEIVPNDPTITAYYKSLEEPAEEESADGDESAEAIKEEDSDESAS